MTETTLPKIDLGPAQSLLSGSPKQMYTYFLLSLAKNYFETIVSKDSSSVESATAGLISFCPSRTKRTELWNLFVSTRDGNGGGNILSASTLTVGELISYLSELLEFEETSSGGFL